MAASGLVAALPLMKSLTVALDIAAWSEAGKDRSVRNTVSLCHSLRAEVSVETEVFSAMMVAMASSQASPCRVEDLSADFHSTDIGAVGASVAIISKRDLAVKITFPWGC